MTVLSLITGTAKHISNETLAAAVVEGKLFNARNERIGIAIDAITFLDPGVEWAFEAESITSNDEVSNLTAPITNPTIR